MTLSCNGHFHLYADELSPGRGEEALITPYLITHTLDEFEGRRRIRTGPSILHLACLSLPHGLSSNNYDSIMSRPCILCTLLWGIFAPISHHEERSKRSMRDGIGNMRLIWRWTNNLVKDSRANVSPAVFWKHRLTKGPTAKMPGDCGVGKMWRGSPSGQPQCKDIILSLTDPFRSQLLAETPVFNCRDICSRRDANPEPVDDGHSFYVMLFMPMDSQPTISP
ncbi:hypothetical protein BDW72DRAFT_166510 [Aspergillus terricola var. indicus]